MRRPTAHLRPRRHLPRRQSGVVMVITLLALVLLAGLVFYVFNIGRAVNNRTQTQHAADATAAAGAGTLARSLNTVAMNNVETTRLIAASAALDATPRVTGFTLTDQEALEQSLRRQLLGTVSGWWVRQELQQMRQGVLREIQALEPMDQLLNASGYDMREMTFYDPPSGSERGRIWQAIEQLEAVSLGTMNSLPQRMAQAAADGGRASLLQGDSEGDADALLVQGASIPWEQGRFEDFRRPTMEGLLPPAIDDTVTNRGPYDAVFGWRFPIGGTSESANGSNDGSGAGAVPVGRGVSRGQQDLISLRPEQYRVGGPSGWMRTAMRDMAAENLRYSRFGERANELARIKYRYLWDGGDIAMVIEPEWETSWSTATNTDSEQIRETAFVAIEIKSLYPTTHPQFGSAGSFAFVSRFDRYGRWRRGARVVYADGWEDPRQWNVEKLSNHIWREQWEYDVTFDGDLGVVPDPENPGPTTVYRIDDYMFVGVNIGQEVPVRNPYNFGDRSELPAPVQFASGAPGPDAAGRRQLAVLGVARRDDASEFWPSRFDADRAYPSSVAVAQAEVFNNHSWDLWTQTWHSQLAPVEQYSAWIDRLEGGADQIANRSDMAPADLAELTQYLRSFDALADIALTH